MVQPSSSHLKGPKPLHRFIVIVRHSPQSLLHKPAMRGTLIVSVSSLPSACSRSSISVSITSFSLSWMICIFSRRSSASGIVGLSFSSRPAHGMGWQKSSLSKNMSMMKRQVQMVEHQTLTRVHYCHLAVLLEPQGSQTGFESHHCA